MSLGFSHVKVHCIRRSVHLPARCEATKFELIYFQIIALMNYRLTVNLLHRSQKTAESEISLSQSNAYSSPFAVYWAHNKITVFAPAGGMNARKKFAPSSRSRGLAMIEWTDELADHMATRVIVMSLTKRCIVHPLGRLAVNLLSCNINQLTFKEINKMC